MKIKRAFRAGLAGVVLAFGVIAPAAMAETLQVIRKGAARDLSITMNQAVVVESDVPFAELSVANPEIADFSTLSDRTIYVLGKSPGRTTLTLLNETGRLITNVNVRVSPDLAEFKERLQQVLSGEAIEVRSANDGIVLSGTVSSITRMDRALELAQRYAPERVSNLMSVSGKQQVMLKVRFAEMQRSVSKALSTSLAIDGFTSGNGHGAGFAGSNLGIGRLGMEDRNIPRGDNAGTAFIGFDIGSTELGILLEALETKGVVRTLAEPNLTALSGQEAQFLAGGEAPFAEADDNGNTTTKFKPFGVILNFIPRVVEDGVINLELAAEVSSIDSANAIVVNNLPVVSFKTRKTSTTVALRDGQSFAIAGLLQDDFRDTNAQVPWIGDVPVLGTLFRSADYQRAQTELVIIISAYLVTPMQGDALALPTDHIQPPSEAQLFLRGRTAVGAAEGQGAVGEVARQDFQGSYGYVME